MNKKSKPTDQYIQSNREVIGNQIRVYREINGLNQDQLAEIMEVNRSTISKIENGKFAITIDYLVKFAWYLEFNISLRQENSK